MKSISKTPALSLEELSKVIMCATEVKPEGDGFIATFQLRNCRSRPQSGISENPKLFWYSPSRCILPCNHSGNSLYGFTYIARAIARWLIDYTVIFGTAHVFLKDGEGYKTGDIRFETTDPREAEQMLLLPAASSEWTSGSWEEAETQRHSLMYGLNDDKPRWGCRKYILLKMGYYYTEKGETPDYEAQANYYRKLATAELIMTGHCPEDLANEFFPGLTHDKVVGGCFLIKTPAKQQVVGDTAVKAYRVIGANGDMIEETMYRRYDNGECERLWLDIPDDALVVHCSYDPADIKFDVTSIQGQVRTATKEQRRAVIKIINDWMAATDK